MKPLLHLYFNGTTDEQTCRHTWGNLGNESESKVKIYKTFVQIVYSLQNTISKYFA